MTVNAGLAELCANSLLNTFRHVSRDIATVYAMLHTNPPGEGGGNNISAGDSSLKLLSFSAASGGGIALSSSPLWTNVDTSETLRYLSTWDGPDGPGTDDLQWVAQLTTTQSWADGDTYTLDECGLILTPIVTD